MDTTSPVTSAGSFVAAGDTATIILKSGNLLGVSSGTRFDDMVVRGAAAPPPDPSAPPPPFDVRLLDFVPTYGGDAPERRRLLETCRAPLLVMRGEKSKISSAQSARRTAQIGKGEVVTIPGAGHNVSLHDPEAVADALQHFLGPLAGMG